MTRKQSIYSVHPGVEMVRRWVETLPDKTGRSLDEWVRLIIKEGPATTKRRREWLKSAHRLGTNSAWWLVDRAEGRSADDGDPAAYLKAAEGWVGRMFSGPKAGLLPIYEKLLAAGRGLGKDVRICPCETIVPFYRNHVIAQVKPSTRTRLDFGFALGDLKAKGRLLDTGGFARKDRITHRIPITTVDEVDEEVTGWLKRAYDLDA